MAAIPSLVVSFRNLPAACISLQASLENKNSLVAVLLLLLLLLLWAARVAREIQPVIMSPVSAWVGESEKAKAMTKLKKYVDVT